MISELANQVEAEWEKQNIHAARASDRVANRLRFDILSGKLPAGCRLLPERRLAEVLNVSRVTVRSAIATLQSEQLLDVRRGSGITVMDYRRSSSIDLFTRLMAGKTLPIEQQFKIFSQVAMVRRRLALPTLLEAIDRAKPADIRRLEQLIQKQQENLDKPDAYLVTDLEISQCIARAADNVVVELLHNSLRRCMGARAELVMAFWATSRRTYKTTPPFSTPSRWVTALRITRPFLIRFLKLLKCLRMRPLSAFGNTSKTKLKNLSATHRIKFSSPNSKPTEGFL